jgi:hypothetical protein
MKISELISRLENIKREHGEQPCWLEYDDSIIHLDGVGFYSKKAERDVYTIKPEGSIYTGVFLTEYEGGENED